MLYLQEMVYCLMTEEASWLWSYGSWIYNYLCNRCLSPLTLWVWILFRRGVLDATLSDKVCQWLAAGRWFSPDIPVSYTNNTDRHDITEILLKMALNTITLNDRILFSNIYFNKAMTTINLSDRIILSEWTLFMFLKQAYQ
jgi:hypothetical protein